MAPAVGGPLMFPLDMAEVFGAGGFLCFTFGLGVWPAICPDDTWPLVAG
jgi:hypothetical protein